MAVLTGLLLLPGDPALYATPLQAEAAASKPEAAKIPPEQLDSLVAPIALYPDPMLAQVLAASTYPLEIIQLQQWLEKNKNLKDKALVDAVSKQPWDPSVQAMAALPDVVKRLANDVQWTTDLGNAFLTQQSDVMDAVQRMIRGVDTGLTVDSVLPGPIKLHSKAAAMQRNLKNSNKGEAGRVVTRIASYGFAMGEENARGHIIVTAPTAGSAGIIPAVVKSLQDLKTPQQKIRDGYLAAAAIGYLCKHNATLSGAEGGCQAEVGVGSSMGAAMIAQALGEGPKVVSNAAESALEHHLGMTCDPVAGYVQVPCIERCAYGAIKAWTAYCIASEEVPEQRRVDLDTTISAMALTAKEMNGKYKETSEGGLAVSVVLC